MAMEMCGPSGGWFCESDMTHYQPEPLGLSFGAALHAVQQAFTECHGLQCGFCTPGMVMSAVDLVQHHGCHNEQQVREALEGNICRCTGYHNIVKAIAPLSDEREVAFARDFLRKVGPEHASPYWHHIGVYAYKRPVLERFVALPVSEREAERKLEQMRAMDNGMRIAVVRVDTVPLGVDTPTELETARRMLRKA